MVNACYLHQFGGDTQSLAELTTELKIFSLEKGVPGLARRCGILLLLAAMPD